MENVRAFFAVLPLIIILIVLALANAPISWCIGVSVFYFVCIGIASWGKDKEKRR